MEVGNKFADGEDAYNNKRACSPEVDRASRQRRRSRNEDSSTRQNQIATGYERWDEEGYKSREFQGRSSRGEEKLKYSGPSAEDMLHGACRIHRAYLDGKRVSNHQMKDCRTFLRLQGRSEPEPRSTSERKECKSRISNATSRRASGIKYTYPQ
jgi:hypothetical protein